jgi:hypothetical protein
MTRKPKELRELERQFMDTLIAVRDLHIRAMELGQKDLEGAAEKAHDALLEVAPPATTGMTFPPGDSGQKR